MNAFRYHKLPLAALIVGLAALVLWAWPSFAAEPVRHNFAGWQSLENKTEGSADQQAAFFLTSPPLNLTDKIHLLFPSIFERLPLTYHGRLQMRVTGLTNEPSSPGNADWGPEGYASYDLSPKWSFDTGWGHWSNFEALGVNQDSLVVKTSRSENTLFARSNYEEHFGDRTLRYSFEVFWVMDSEYPEFTDLRTIGDGGKWGLSLDGQYEWPGLFTASAMVADNLAHLRIREELSGDGLNFYVAGQVGKRIQMADDARHDRMVQGGIEWEW